MKTAWVPGVLDYKIQNGIGNLGIRVVANLIDSNTKKWRAKIMNNTFSENDTNRILCIPLVRFPHNDYMVWQGEA
ncbi:hypothetical protein Goklo_028939 [Gossypium klotzschianum]|nr:hypothetical protein [Gossypium klotzschianum]